MVPPSLSNPSQNRSFSLSLSNPSVDTPHTLLTISSQLLAISFPSLSPSISASYSLFSSSSGQPLASLDDTLLTLLRTSALSVAVFAHLYAHPSLSRFHLWNRTLSKSQTLASNLQNFHPELTFEVARDLDETVEIADVITCSTGSERPLVRGELIKKGVHMNLIGSYMREMRECDEVVVRRGGCLWTQRL